MALVRLISGSGLRPPASGSLLLALALAACRSSEAGPNSGLTPPPGWSALPSLASAANDAAKAGRIKVDGVEAFGDPARGCYAAWVAMHDGGGAPDAMAEQLVRGLSADPSLWGILIRDVQKPAPGAASGVLSLGFDRGNYRGMLRATLGKDGAIAALACFWNTREPAACEPACKGLVGSMK